MQLNTAEGVIVVDAGTFADVFNNFGTKQDMILPYNPSSNINEGIIKYKIATKPSSAFVQVYDSLTATWNEIVLNENDTYNLGSVLVNQMANGQIKLKNLNLNLSDTLYFCDVNNTYWFNNLGVFNASLSKIKVGYQTDSLYVDVT